MAADGKGFVFVTTIYWHSHNLLTHLPVYSHFAVCFVHCFEEGTFFWRKMRRRCVTDSGIHVEYGDVRETETNALSE